MPPRDLLLFHYTDKSGFQAIKAQVDWIFKTADPPGKHPHGAYFTTLDPRIRNLANRLRIPRSKVEYVFCFRDSQDLIPLAGGRGLFILYSPQDYLVERLRQVFSGPSKDFLEDVR
ncbi:hypothetical protein BH23PLA1_BH23PLA1_23760 [soil metagenome]